MKTSFQSPSLWRNRDYLLLWSGQLISATGTGVSQIAFPLLILAITGSPLQAGLIGAVRSLTYVLVILPAGALLDRRDRKLVMIISDVGRALVMTSIFVAITVGHLSIVQLYFTAFLEVLLATFFDIAEISCLPQVVSKEQIPEALGRAQASTGVMNLLSPALGGALFAIKSLLPFLVDALSYVVSVVTLFLICTPFQQQREVSPVQRTLLVEIGVGLRWLWREPLLRTMALLTCGNIFFGAGQVLIVIVIAQQQHASASTIGLIFGAGGLGGILGSLLVGRVQQRLSFTRVILAALWLYAIFWLPLALLPAPLLVGLIVFSLFFIGPFYNVTNISRRLAMTPDALQSRVNSVARLIALSFSPFGMALTGLLLQYSGPRFTILCTVGGQLLLALVATFNPHIRHAQPLKSLLEQT